MSLLLHIGYHKTATTWMQRVLFQPRHGYTKIATHQEVSDLVTRPHGLHFDPRPMRDLIASRLSAAGTLTPVISSEILSGHPFFGGRESDIFARRLLEIVPDARILISIRAQHRILPSVYMQYLQRGGIMPPEQFFQGPTSVGYQGFDPDHFCYDRLIGTYQNLFPQVLVLPQELLKENPDGTVQTLANFAGNKAIAKLRKEDVAPQGTSPPEAIFNLLRRMNHFQTSTLNPCPVWALGAESSQGYRLAQYLSTRSKVASRLKTYKPVSQFVATRFAGHFSKSNLRLAAFTASPLKALGYP